MLNKSIMCKEMTIKYTTPPILITVKINQIGRYCNTLLKGQNNFC